MIDALQTLVDNGLSIDALKKVLADLIDNNVGSDVEEQRCLVALEWHLGNRGDCSPDDCTFGHDDIVYISSGEYRVLTDDEANVACAEYIKEFLWTFNSSFLASETGIDESVFKALASKCDENNGPLRALIVGTCGLDKFIDSAISSNGRGHFLSFYDGDWKEIDCCNGWYIYRVS